MLIYTALVYFSSKAEKIQNYRFFIDLYFNMVTEAVSSSKRLLRYKVACAFI